jgi:predicted O-methyltransferase YrrM
MRPDVAAGFGPLNGQEIRQSVLEALMRAFRFDLIIETGTYRGTTTEWLRARSTAPMVTIEISQRFYEYARRRLAQVPDVRVVLGESSAEIRRLAASPTHDREATVFAYLDAHWGSTLPVRCELLELLTG